MDSHAAISLGKYMFPLFALALDLPENFFDDKVSVLWERPTVMTDLQTFQRLDNEACSDHANALLSASGRRRVRQHYRNRGAYRVGLRFTC